MTGTKGGRTETRRCVCTRVHQKHACSSPVPHLLSLGTHNHGIATYLTIYASYLQKYQGGNGAGHPRLLTTRGCGAVYVPCTPNWRQLQSDKRQNVQRGRELHPSLLSPLSTFSFPQNTRRTGHDAKCPTPTAASRLTHQSLAGEMFTGTNHGFPYLRHSRRILWQQIRLRSQKQRHKS